MPKWWNDEHSWEDAEREARLLMDYVAEIEEGARAAQSIFPTLPRNFQYGDITGDTIQIVSRDGKVIKIVPQLPQSEAPADDVTGAAASELPSITDATLIDAFPDIIELVEKQVAIFDKSFQGHISGTLLKTQREHLRASLIKFFLESLVVVKRKSK